ncbi:protein FAR-RED IMPAIRED RESPONSE 1-like [Prunus yedoensis var. nudiflora]|uniref:Protein FAR-RED IMPAIRED RESPONSE 1-like n=1 Tax=Prunus yedoensis var. nudiflora TaxID=2094558 RepID=A0A314Z3L9_PRUYE|nr:protein FAR-RED IMPAIRED RESPONSE 1-like [Prunus yedoensis var. nudiflora]
MKDPHQVKAKGCARRVKGQKEKAAEGHKRRCSKYRKTNHERRTCPKLVSPSSTSDTEVGAAIDENLQPSQSTHEREPTMTESFLQEFDFIYGPGV